ncbi:hypothetical protein CPB84DRAFT_1765286 [Gymnopilus junonius]|uniref:Kelch motif family protein n=1 Tax=Gymnopilus junonius TaxID=109634 RepID=A0A9P5TTI7_GYMJU|nr:hypothetical protein CPB84DRAFT_1765286 [Gymnopilus junonius]
MPVTRATKNRPLVIHEPVSSRRTTKKSGIDSQAEVWVAKKLQGKYPPLTSHSKSAIDLLRGNLYFYGGYRPEDKREVPTADFRVFNIKTKKFVNLTNSLTHIMPADPDSDVKPEPHAKRLPRLSQPGMALLEVKGNPIIFLFGGYDFDASSGADGTSSALVAIDITRKQWYYVQFEDSDFSPPTPRIDPIVVGINEKLYIFSGLTGFGNNWVYHRSFSIVYFQLGRCSKWVAVDSPYPSNVPAGHVFGKGLSVYDGKMILLLPGRKQETERIHFEKDNIFHFAPMHNNFIQANVKGSLPKDVVWFYVSPLDRSFNSPQGAPPYGTPGAVPSVIICTWLPHKNGDLSPELWKFVTFPTNTFFPLGVIDRVYDLEVDFQRFALIGNRAFLLGQGDYPEKAAMCNTYVEIPMEELLIKHEPD